MKASPRDIQGDAMFPVEAAVRLVALACTGASTVHAVTRVGEEVCLCKSEQSHVTR